MITPQNVLRHEFIGLSAAAHHPKNDVRHKGTIVDETRDTLTLKTTTNTTKKITKKDHIFEVELPGGVRVRMAGALLAGRPEDRIKKKIRITYANH